MRKLALVAALGLACTTVSVPAMAADDPSQCTWAVSKVPAPSGYDPAFTRVKGTDSHGNYAGTSRRPGTNTNDVVLWTNGQPHVVQELAHLGGLEVRGENSAGTVLVSGRIPGQQRLLVLLYSGGHQGTGTITELVAPEGYQLSAPDTLNERGDVLGGAVRLADGASVGLVWSTVAAAPRIIERSDGIPEDLDDDGTVLLRRDGGGYLWRDGQLTRLADEGRQIYPQAIRGGKVVGYRLDGSWPSSQSLLWDSNGNVQNIQDGGTAYAVNAGGLITGERSDIMGRASVWRDTAFQSELPYPDGVTGVFELFVVGNDDSLFSHAYSHGPLRWTCA
ncbi:hypothetical protein GCM10022267_55640 [Lentzea roselyniae]|uniref:Extracellular repeat, HAF family n=1 Tax=Lentzea roselyniae TaxID=531940 RepID=A0ABP7BL36_9PSEU